MSYSFNTEELNIHGIQCNCVGIKIENNYDDYTLNIYMINGSIINISGCSKEKLNKIKNTILYYPVNKENSAYEFNFSMLITYMS